jgi:hypothetical protein
MGITTNAHVGISSSAVSGMQADGLLDEKYSRKLVGKVAVITGGSTGMGLATAKRFVKEA